MPRPAKHATIPVAFANSTTPVKKQERAIQTHEHLIMAARKVFARDGFAQARIEDIAALAGKTRGAFYTNFRDKEDVFIAIIEDDFNRYKKDFLRNLCRTTSVEEKREALAQHFYKVICDEQRVLLMLEFKMYAIRHPQKKKRLADLHHAICARFSEGEMSQYLGEFKHKTGIEKRRETARVSAAIDGLAINRLFDPESFSEERVMTLLRSIAAELFDC
ncbi:TetR family transcriptional regulator [Silvibacterium sp.]|uniref:TetR family transcriptional regulator n=1 Tax=Silvibacterium sp. TaxID=1964179 RepID=UPI0039E40FE2